MANPEYDSFSKAIMEKLKGTGVTLDDSEPKTVPQMLARPALMQGLQDSYNQAVGLQKEIGKTTRPTYSGLTMLANRQDKRVQDMQQSAQHKGETYGKYDNVRAMLKARFGALAKGVTLPNGTQNMTPRNTEDLNKAIDDTLIEMRNKQY